MLGGNPETRLDPNCSKPSRSRNRSMWQFRLHQLIVCTVSTWRFWMDAAWLQAQTTNLPTPEADKQTAETIGHVLDMCDLCDMWLLHWKQRCRTICLIWHSPLQLIASRNGLELFYRFGFLILKRLTLRVFCCQQVYSGREGIKAESINSHSRQNIWSVRSSLSLA